MSQPVHNVAILFADISGSTRLYESLGDVTARDILGRAIEFLSAQIGEFQGRVVKTIGDEVMAVFPTADLALQGACAMQRGLTSPVVAQGFKPAAIRIRVGFHAGPVICEGGDVFGDAVNVAARMGQAAKADQILTTLQTLEQIPHSEALNKRIVDRTTVKGKQDPIDIYEVLWEEKDATVIWTSPAAFAAPQVQLERPRLRLHLQDGRVLELSSCRTSISLGRGMTNDVVVNSPSVSRTHASIELRKGGKVAIKDQSTNGTYLHEIGQAPQLVRREELIVNQSGVLALGIEIAKAKEELLRFEILPAASDA